MKIKVNEKYELISLGLNACLTQVSILENLLEKTFRYDGRKREPRALWKWFEHAIFKLGLYRSKIEKLLAGGLYSKESISKVRGWLESITIYLESMISDYFGRIIYLDLQIVARDILTSISRLDGVLIRAEGDSYNKGEFMLY
ncbi:MAG: hypothetical protein R2780_01790 [Crocinitomicaceae bacterium]